jgi:hypothetical protein
MKTSEILLEKKHQYYLINRDRILQKRKERYATDYILKKIRVLSDDNAFEHDIYSRLCLKYEKKDNQCKICRVSRYMSIAPFYFYYEEKYSNPITLCFNCWTEKHKEKRRKCLT